MPTVAANNQWRLEEELVSDLSQTSFRKALELCEGAVSILDSGGVVFSRAWRAQPHRIGFALGVSVRRLSACATCALEGRQCLQGLPLTCSSSA